MIGQLVIPNHPVLKLEEELELARMYKAGDRKAGDRLIAHNFRIVAKLAWGLSGYNVDMEELYQQGCMGMARALQKFDPARGLRFASYASNWAKAYMNLFILANISLVKIGTTQAQRRLFYKMAGIRRRLERDGWESSAITVEIARLLETKVEEVEEMTLRMAHPIYSLDAQIPPWSKGSAEDQTTFMDLLVSPETSAEEALAEHDTDSTRRRLVRRALRVLDPREQQIIKARVMSSKPVTLETLSLEFGCSRERVRQLEKRAYRKLKQELERLGGENQEEFAECLE
jgi:RNA polymerase sigma-32 factor